MSPAPRPDRRTLALVLGSLLGTVVTQRLYLHLLNPHADLFVAGHNVHHLFTGALMLIPAALVLTLRPNVRGRSLALAALGSGSAMVLDEVVFLIATDGSNAAYLTPVSLWGAVVMIGLATLLVLKVHRCAAHDVGKPPEI